MSSPNHKVDLPRIVQRIIESAEAISALTTSPASGSFESKHRLQEIIAQQRAYKAAYRELAGKPYIMPSGEEKKVESCSAIGKKDTAAGRKSTEVAGETTLKIKDTTEFRVVFATGASSAQLPLATYILSHVLNVKDSIHFERVESSNKNMCCVLYHSNDKVVSGDFSIARFLCRYLAADSGLYGVFGMHSFNNIQTMTRCDSFLDLASQSQHHDGEHTTLFLSTLNRFLKDKTFLVGYSISIADIAIYARLVAMPDVKWSEWSHLSRYFHYFQSQTIFQNVVESLQKASKPAPGMAKQDSRPAFSSQKGKKLGNCPPLKNAVEGNVVTRFPPEPSGYLHIGHVKACMLNYHYAKLYNGKLIVRFDDTNPSKEKEEFELSIVQDLKKLEIVPDTISYTSDHFDQLIAYAYALIEKSLAYMDNTPQEQMRDERMHGIPSKCRDQSVELNRSLFQKLLSHTSESFEYCLRAKIDMTANNKTLRDPVIFRHNPLPHHRTHARYSAYPTYDFACPIVDSLEGVTHALRTTEYNDRDAQYRWFIETLGLRYVEIHAFARMNFVNSVLSKRKLQYFVDSKHVTGWNDPRFPTIQGVLRRGVQVEALREFILSQGASRRITDMEWDKFWTINKKVIDPKAARYTAIEMTGAVPLRLHTVENRLIGIPIAKHPKIPEMGDKIVRFQPDLLIERDDANCLEEGAEITLMRYGNIIIRKIMYQHIGSAKVIERVEAENHPEGDFKKTKLKINWLANVPDLVPLQLVEFDFLITKPKLDADDDFKQFLNSHSRAEMTCIGDHGLRDCVENEIIQLERRGYFRVDRPYVSKDKPVVLFMVPDGKARAMSTLSTNLAHR